jgi:ribosomal protein S18 acetylase RimI-like enzyme
MSQTESVVNTRPAVAADVSGIAALHATCIQEGFLVRLGRPFLRRLYRRAVRSPHAFVLVTGGDGDVRGFIAATEDTRAFYREFLVRDAVIAGIVALPRIAGATRSVFETLRYGVRDHADLPKAEILAVAVSADLRGQGAGVGLITAALRELAYRGIASARVVTAVDNDAALRAYERAGLRRCGTTQVHRGVAQAVLVWP